MVKYGIKSARKNENVRLSDIVSNTINSLKNTLKIAMSGYGTASVPSLGMVGGPRWELEVDHNLGYKPIVLFYYKHPSNSRWHKAISYTNVNSGASWALYASYSHVDTNTVKFVLYDGVLDPMPLDPTDVEYKYYIMIDPRKDAWYE